MERVINERETDIFFSVAFDWIMACSYNIGRICLTYYEYEGCFTSKNID